MKSRLSFQIFLLPALITLVVAQNPSEILPRGLTTEERTRLDEIGVNRTITNPPDSVVYAPAEYDSLDGILYAWEAYPTLLTQLIKETAEDDTAWVVVDNQTEADTVYSQLSAAGIDMMRVQFIFDGLNSVWMRDYGPWWIVEPDGSLAIIDLVYNRPRPADDAFPEDLANQWGLNYYGTALVEAGGNLLLDGHGTALVSDVVFDASQGFDPDLTETQLEQYLHDYFGVTNLIITDHLDYDGTGHIDMFVKIINDSTIIVGEYATPGDGAGNNYTICNQVAAQLAAATNSAGEPFNIVRVPMPAYSGGVTYTHINSLIVNKKVFVPTYGGATDNTAIAAYQQAMPEYEIIGFDCNQIITANGAIHCIAMKVPAAIPLADPCADWVVGDVNNDQTRDIMDVLLTVDFVLEHQNPGQCAFEAADGNGDGDVDILDVITLIRNILELD